MVRPLQYLPLGKFPVLDTLCNAADPDCKTDIFTCCVATIVYYFTQTVSCHQGSLLFLAACQQQILDPKMAAKIYLYEMVFRKGDKCVRICDIRRQRGVLDVLERRRQKERSFWKKLAERECRGHYVDSSVRFLLFSNQKAAQKWLAQILPVSSVCLRGLRRADCRIVRTCQELSLSLVSHWFIHTPHDDDTDAVLANLEVRFHMAMTSV